MMAHWLLLWAALYAMGWLSGRGGRGRGLPPGMPACTSRSAARCPCPQQWPSSAPPRLQARHERVDTETALAVLRSSAQADTVDLDALDEEAVR